jgi:hypothetical protein
VALTETETYGTVVPGFVTDLDGNLAVTTDDSQVQWREGFLRDLDGRLVVAEEEGIWQDGFLRTAGGALCVTTGEVTQHGTKIPGYPTDDDGLICVVNDGSPAFGLYPGFMFDGGKLCVTGLGSEPPPGVILYEESFTDDDGEWSGVTVARVTDQYQSAPASLKASITGEGNFFSPNFDSGDGNMKLKAWVMSPNWTGGDIVIALADFDGGGAFGPVTLTDTWQQVTVPTTDPLGDTCLVVVSIDAESAPSEPSDIYIDTITVEAT